MAASILYTIASRLNGGGIGTTAYHEAAGLLRAGRLGEVLCLGTAETAIPAERVRTVGFLPRRSLPFLSDRWFYYAKNRRFDRMARTRVEHFDRLHAWTGQCPDAIAEARRRGMTIVLHRASSHILTQIELLKDECEIWGLRPELPLKHVVYNCLREYETADLIVVPSQFAKNSFLDHGLPERRIVVNPFGVDSERIRPTDREPHEAVRLLYVGEVGVRKGAIRLLRLFDHLDIPGARLELAGSIKPELAGLIGAYRGRESIAFHDYVNDVRPLLERADIFVFPTIEEGSALAVYEAMAAGLPVVTSERAGSIIESGISGFVLDLHDEAAWVDVLRTLAADPDLRARIGREARKRAEAYSWEAFGDRAAAIHARLDGER